MSLHKNRFGIHVQHTVRKSYVIKWECLIRMLYLIKSDLPYCFRWTLLAVISCHLSIYLIAPISFRHWFLMFFLLEWFLVDIAAITEVRRWKTDFYKEIEKRGYSKKRLDSALNKKLCFTIVFGQREYNLIAQDEEISNLWLSTLKKVVCIVRAVHHENQYWM
jgi:hypothetical protein